MSFTADVKDEVSRIEPEHEGCAYALLSAMTHTLGSLYIGSGGSRIELSSESASVARCAMRLLHSPAGLVTELTVRKSVLHKSRNYLLTVPSQPNLADALSNMGIIKEDGIETGVCRDRLEQDCCAASYLRGAFLGGGFVSDPKGDFHLEISCQNDAFAEGLLWIAGRFGVAARCSPRRNLQVVYLKSADDIMTVLAAIGAHRCVCAMEEVRVMKSMRNDVNRRVNAELANQVKSQAAVVSQLRAIERLRASGRIDSLPPALADVARLRTSYPEASFRELGELAEPALSKSAISHRMRRLEELSRL